MKSNKNEDNISQSHVEHLSPKDKIKAKKEIERDNATIGVKKEDTKKK